MAAKLFHQLSGHNNYALGRLQEDLEDLRVLKQETPSVEVERSLPKLAGEGENGEILGASSKIKLAGSKEDPRGRYVVAAADLGPGEVILTEPAYAACLHAKYYGTHCSACFSR